MSDINKIQGEVSLDSTNAEQAFARVEAGGRKMASALKESGAAADKAIAGVGDGAEQAVQKTGRATASILASITRAQSETQRLLADSQGYARGSAEGIEELARLRGVDTSAIRGQINALSQLQSEYSVLQATQREASSAALFEREHQAARKLVQDAEYVRMWTTALAQKEAAERATASQDAFVDSLRKQSAAIGKTRADLLEMQAAQMGVSSQAAPYIAQLRASEQGLGRLGASAAQTAAAMRMVPAQFTDIFVSLQGGMPFITVLLQQGGQLKDMFGGIGPAARALGGYVAGLVSPLTLAAGAAGVLALAYYQGSKEADAYSKSLILSGNAAGATVSGMQAAAQAISAVKGTQGQAAAALAEMAQSGAVGAQSLQAFTAAALNWERTTGTAVSKVAENFGSLKDKPLEASLKLNEGMNYLTVSVYQQIKALEEQGRTTEAANLAQRTFADTLEQRSSQMTANLGLIERGWNAVKAAVLGAGSAIAGVGRTQTSGEELSAVQTRIAALRAEQANAGFGTNAGGAAFGRRDGAADAARKQELADLELKAKRLAVVVQTENEAAAAEARRAEMTAALSRFDKEGDQFKTRAAKRDEEIVKARVEGQKLIQAGLISEADLRARIADIEAKYKDKKGATGSAASGENEVAGIRARIQEEQTLLERLRERGLQDSKLTEGERLVKKIQEELATSISGRVRAQKELALAEAGQLVVVERNRIAQEALLSGQKALEKARASETSAVEDSILKLNQQADALELELSGQAATAQAIQRTAVARLQERAAVLQAFEGNEAVIDQINREIAARERLIADLDRKDRVTFAKKVADDQISENERAAEAYERRFEQVGQSLADSLMRGGKSAGEYLKDYFRTLVFRPLIAGVVNVAGGALLGTAAQAAQGTSLGSTLNSASTAYSLYSNAGSYLNTASGLLNQGAAYLGFGPAAASTISSNIGTAVALGIEQGSAAAAANAAAAASASTATGGAGLMAGIATAVPYVAAAAIVANALGLFRSTKVTDVGISGNLGGNGQTSLEAYTETRRGGSLFSGPSYSRSPSDMPAEQLESIRTATDTVYSSIAGYGAALGLSADAIDGYIQAINLSTQGMTSEQVTAALENQFAVFGDQLADRIAPGLGAFAKAGEQYRVTLARLATSIGAVNGVTAALGQRSLELSLAGGAAASALLDLAGGASNLQSLAGGYLESFYTQAERSALATRQVAEAFGALGVAMPASREELRRLVEAQDLSTTAGQQAYVGLLQLAGAFSSLKDQLRATAEGAFDDLSKAVQAQRQTVSTAIAGLSKLSESINGTLGSLSADGSAGQARAAAQAQIAAALAIARAGGVSTIDQAGLAQALATVAQDSKGLFGSREEYLRDLARTAGDLAALGQLTDAALTTEQASLDRLDGILGAAQAQIDALKGVNTSVLSVQTAVGALAVALAAANGDPGMAGRLAGIINGSHAAGLARVPFDGYVAELHRGERVLTASEARQYDVPGISGPPGQGNAELVTEVRAMRQEMAALRARNDVLLREIALRTGQSAEALTEAARGSQPLAMTTA